MPDVEVVMYAVADELHGIAFSEDADNGTFSENYQEYWMKDNDGYLRGCYYSNIYCVLEIDRIKSGYQIIKGYCFI